MNKNAFSVGTWAFFRVLAVVHGVAFLSYWLQLDGLVGPHGLLPAVRYFAVVHERVGDKAYFALPSLCWIFGASWFLHALCGAGLALAVLLFAGFAPAICLALLWVFYLSLMCAGQSFFDFQWDALLLETTLLAIFAAPWSLRPGWKLSEPPKLARWLLWWLLFRLMFLSGVVKLASGDPSWRHLTALVYHFETQPLPTPVAWYASHLPPAFDRVCCGVMFVIEIVAPFALAAPRRFRHAAALAIAVFQGLIALTGNYTFFNLLTASLCLLCLDDAWWASVFGFVRRILDRRQNLPAVDAASSRVSPHLRSAPPKLLRLFAAFVVFCTGVQAAAEFAPAVARSPLTTAVMETVGPFRSLNNYGLFTVMTTTRPELVFEGSDDGLHWKPYVLPYKPGPLDRRPAFVAPYQPRLDWQLWFAALEELPQNRWVLVVCQDLLQGNSHVLSLFSENPFPDRPPQFIRVVRFEYHFTTPAERAATGDWWKRTMLDFYVPEASLQ